MDAENILVTEDIDHLNEDAEYLADGHDENEFVDPLADILKEGDE